MNENQDLAEINIENFQSIIENYESIIKDLTNQLDILKAERDKLHCRISYLLEKKEKLTYEKGTGDSLLENLKEQLNFVTQEKDSISVLWQNSLQTINHLENELKFYENVTEGLIPKGEYDKFKILSEQKVAALENELKEAKLKLEVSLKTKTKEVEQKNTELVKAVETQTNTFKIVNNLEDEILKLQERLHTTQESKNDLEKELSLLTDKTEALRRENQECREKVSEAVQVVQAALNEKDAALMREKLASDEIERLTKTLSEIIDEAGQKVKNEVELVKKEYNNRLREILHDLKTAKNELKEKNLEIEKFIRNSDDLKNEIERLKKSSYSPEENITKLMSLEKSLESTFQKLLVSEKQNVQLQSEQECLKADIEQMAKHYERDIRAREVEKTTLQTKIKNLQTELDETHNKFIGMSEKMDALNGQIRATEKEFREQIVIKESMLKNSQVDINKKHSDVVMGLQKHAEAQMKMNQKWRIETKEIVERLHTHISETQSELQNVKKENYKLRRKLNESNLTVREFRKIFKTISADINHLTEGVTSRKDFVKSLLKDHL